MLADAVDPRAIGTDIMSAMHYRYQYDPDALAAPALLQSYSLLLQRWETSHTQELNGCYAYLSGVGRGRMPCSESLEVLLCRTLGPGIVSAVLMLTYIRDQSLAE